MFIMLSVLVIPFLEVYAKKSREGGKDVNTQCYF